jgi:hypothetical protein
MDQDTDSNRSRVGKRLPRYEIRMLVFMFALLDDIELQETKCLGRVPKNYIVSYNRNKIKYSKT